MYYAEKIIGGVLHWRGTPTGEWIPKTLEGLTKMLLESREKVQKVYENFAGETFNSPIPDPVCDDPDQPFKVGDIVNFAVGWDQSVKTGKIVAIDNVIATVQTSKGEVTWNANGDNDEEWKVYIKELTKGENQ